MENTNNELVLLVKQSGLQETKQNEIAQLLESFFKAADEAKAMLETLVITDPKEVGKMKIAREGRLTLRKSRLDLEKLLDEKRSQVQSLMSDFKLEDQLLLKSKQIGVALFKNLEEKYEEKEKFAENWERQQKEQRKAERLAICHPYAEFIPVESLDLANMTEDGFNKLIAGAKAQQEQKEKDAAEAERVRNEEEAKQALHKTRNLQMIPLFAYSDIAPDTNFGELSEASFRIIIENATTKKDEHFKEQERIRIENERLKKEQEEAAAKLKAIEDQAREDKRIADEAAAKLKAENDAKLKKEQEEKAVLEKQIADKKAEEEKKEAQRIADEKKAAKAPDREKIRTMLHLCNLSEISFQNKESAQVYSDIVAKFEGFKKWAIEQIERL